MTAIDTALPAAPPQRRRGGAFWVAIAVLVTLVVLVAFHGGMRALMAHAWHELCAIPVPALALIVALKVGQALLGSLSWTNALRSAWPRAGLSYRFVVGIDQGQDVVNTILPGRAGTWAMLGVVRLAIPGARVRRCIGGGCAMDPDTLHILEDVPADLSARRWALVSREPKLARTRRGSSHVAVYERPYHAPVDHLGTAVTVRAGKIHVSTAQARCASRAEARQATIDQMRAIDAPRPRREGETRSPG